MWSNLDFIWARTLTRFTEQPRYLRRVKVLPASEPENYRPAANRIPLHPLRTASPF